MTTIIFAILLAVSGIFMGYNIAMSKIYGWMSDILEPIPATLENRDFLLGVIFAQAELDKKIRHLKRNKKED